MNIVPPRARISTYVRGASMAVLEETNRKVDRALAAGALAMGAKVHVADQPGYAPMSNYPLLEELAERVLGEFAGPEQVGHLPWNCGCTDLGDISCVIRTIQPHVAGASGTAHGDDFRISDPESACVTSAKGQLLLAAALLENDAAEAKRILAGPAPLYASKEEYFAVIEKFSQDRDLVKYTEEGATIVF